MKGFGRSYPPESKRATQQRKRVVKEPCSAQRAYPAITSALGYARHYPRYSRHRVFPPRSTQDSGQDLDEPVATHGRYKPQ